MENDFRKFAVHHLGMNGLALDQFAASVSNNYINPTIMEERQLNVTQLDVFSRLMMDRIIFLGTQVEDYTANVIQAQLLYLDSADPGKDISLYINSPGGSVYAGLGIYDTMQYIQSDVSTICTGMAASMAAVLLVAGQKDKRFALKHSRVMIHQPMGGISGQASDIEITSREILKLKKELYTIISDHSGQPYDKVYAGLGIYDTMQYIQSDVSTICTGMAASMAAVLLVAGQKDKRFALKHSRVMIHQPMGGISGQASDIEITSREILKLKQELYTIISDHSGQPYDKVYADSDRDYWMTAAEAKDYGMIDKVLIREAAPAANQTEEK